VSLVLRPGGAAGSGGDYPSQGAVAAVIVVVALVIVVRVVVARVGEAVDRSRERRRRGQFPRFTAVPRPRHVQLRSGRVHHVAAADVASLGGVPQGKRPSIESSIRIARPGVQNAKQSQKFLGSALACACSVQWLPPSSVL